MSNRELVLKAICDVFINRDITAFDKYFSENYIQHNPHLPNGTSALKQFIPKISETFNYEPGIITESENIVMIHSRYKDWNKKNMIAVDICGIENRKIMK